MSDPILENTQKTINDLTVAALEDGLPADLEHAIQTMNSLSLRVGIALTYNDNKAAVARALGMHPDTLYKKFNDPVFADQVERVRVMVLRHMASHALNIGEELLERHFVEAVLTKIEALRSSDERIRQKAASEIIDRVSGKPSPKQSPENGGSATNIYFINEGIHPDQLRIVSEEDIVDGTLQE